jgi:cholesterol transport system auxiliary component
MKTKLGRLADAGLLTLALAGCSVLPKPPPAPARHDFGPTRGSLAALPWSQAEVVTPEWLLDSAMHYRLLYASPTELRSYTRDSWVAPPSELLANRLNAGQRSGTRRVTVTLQNFEQVFDRPGNSSVVMRFHARADSGGAGTTAAEWDFRFEMATPTGDAAGALRVYPQLIQKAEAALRAWVIQLPN